MPLAHGLGGVRDLPVPTWLFFWGAGVVLAVSFVALAVLWRRPLLEAKAAGRPLPGWLQRVLTSPVLRVALQAVAFVLLVVVWAAAAFGKDTAALNLAPTFVYANFWVGMVPLVVLFGNVWAVLNPWRAAADGAATLARALGARYEPPLRYPDRLGRWPAAIGLLAFVALELAYVESSRPRALAIAIGVYSFATWLGMAAFGRRDWLENGEAFTVYFGLLARISPFASRDGEIVVRTPASGLAMGMPRPGTQAFIAVMLGSVAFDGFSRTTLWQDRYYSVQVDLLDSPGLADVVGTLMNLGGLIGAILVVALAFRLAVAAAAWVVEEPARLGQAFALTLVPIALVYAIAHYFSLLVYQGQYSIKLASDPFGWGWDLFGTSDFAPNLELLTPNAIWYVQVVALVVGHVLGLVLAHDRALGLFRSGGSAVWSQYPMLVLMVGYTVTGLWLLSQG